MIKLLHIPAALLAVAVVACGSADYAHTVRFWSLDGITLAVAEAPDPAASEDTEGNAEPASQHDCGYVAWCCYRIECKDGPVASMKGVPVCPKLFGFTPYNLEGAWRYWQYKMTLTVREMHKERGHIACGIKEMGCFDEPQSYCPTYPPGYPG